MALDLRSAPFRSPEWWLARLLARLHDRRYETDLWQRYYDGRHPLSFFTEAFREVFEGVSFRRFSSNFVLLVVDGLAERLEVQGFRFSDPEGDEDLWAIWQENDLDGGSQQAHVEALTKSVAYTLVESRGPGTPPRITIETADDCITENDPKERWRRLAGLKRWLDGDGHLVVYVYDEERVYKYRSVKPWPERIEGWPARSMLEDSVMAIGGFDRLVIEDEDWGAEHGIGRVPLVPIVNRPRIDGRGRSEVEAITSHQDAINYYRAGAIIASRKMAIPQRYIANYEIEEGKQLALNASNDIWAFPGRDRDPEAPDPKFDYQIGQFAAVDMSPYLRLIESEVWQMASISRMPYQELLAQPVAIPASGEAQKASESGLIRKVGKTEIHFGEGWEETMRVALRAMRDERADLRTAETIWAPAETRNEAVRTDSVVKLKGIGLIDDETGWEMIGLSNVQKARLRANAEEREKAAAPPPQEPVPAPTGPRMTRIERDETGVTVTER